MSSVDHELGKRVAAHLASLNVETPLNREAVSINASEFLKFGQNQDVMKSHATIMHSLRLDMSDDSLKDTPRRVAKMYCEEIFTGLDYDNFPKCTTFDNKMLNNELIIVKGAAVHSVCEHHFVAFIGHADVAYIPGSKMVGLSKIHRVVDFFSRRPQVQERLNLQIYHALCYILGTPDVAVTIEAEHMCVRLRGIKQTGSTTITSQMGGRFMEKPALREEFLALTRRK